MLFSLLTHNKSTMKLFLLIGLTLYKAKGLSQALIIAITAAINITFLETLKRFILPKVLDNWAIFLILLLLDILSGVYKHSGLWAKGQPNTLNKDDFFFKLFRKVFAGATWLLLINVILTSQPEISYFESFGISVLISWLSWSIASNIYVISGSTFPPAWVMERLKNYNTKNQENE